MGKSKFEKDIDFIVTKRVIPGVIWGLVLGIIGGIIMVAIFFSLEHESIYGQGQLRLSFFCLWSRPSFVKKL